MKLLLLLTVEFALAIPALSQTKPAAKPPAKPARPAVAPAKAPADNWQKSKECAAQAEKFIGDRDVVWENHYSPKYNKCYVKTFQQSTGFFQTHLYDAFERTDVAFWVSTIEEGGKSGPELCYIGSKRSDCSVAFDYTTEHMEN
jgi:hypothetical protein